MEYGALQPHCVIHSRSVVRVGVVFVAPRRPAFRWKAPERCAFWTRNVTRRAGILLGNGER